MSNLFLVQYSILIPLMPLIGAVIAGFFGAKWLKGNSHWPIWIGVGFSALLSICLITEMIQMWHAGQAAELTAIKNYFTWFEAGQFHVSWGYFFDPLTAVMLCVVCGIGFFITVFAAGYMKGEEGYFRFFAYLGLFIFMMTNLVMGENLIMLYLGWEGVGLSSYLLIGYYYEKPSARDAAKKAFLVNRVGDFGFSLGIMLSFLTFGTISYFGHGVGTHTGLLELATLPVDQLAKISTVNIAWVPTAMKWIPFLLMLGAFGKSAQFPLYVWLPDAMEGPTPVSALIHAATMVTAGIYMIVRCGTLFVGNEAAMMTIAFVGAFTALFAATIALRQFDLKKVFAYSTISQLGFMFVGVGCLAPVAGVFHLVTHAFFKALLFLSSGVVMHAMAGELDMSKMSGLKRVLPKTRWLMLIGCFALSGFPFFSGFFSKDEIVGNSYLHNKFLGIVMLFTAFLTAYYTFRLYFRVFEGPLVIPPPPDGGHGHGGHGHDDSHGQGSLHGAEDAEGAKATEHDDHHHNHEPAIMIVPLVVLAIGAIFAGYLNWPERENSLGGFLGNSPSIQLAYQTADKAYPNSAEPVAAMPFGQFASAAQQEEANREWAEHQNATHFYLMFISGAISAAGIGLAYLLHLKNRRAGDELPEKAPLLARLFEAKYWVDEIYQAVIVEPLRALGRGFFWVDRMIVDGIVWLVSFIPQLGGWILKLTTERGYLQGYAASMLFGIAVILLIIFWQLKAVASDRSSVASCESDMGYLLLLLILIPLIGAIVGAFIQCAKMARAWALIVALATLVITVILATQFTFNQDLSGVKAAQRMSKSVQIEFGNSPDNPFAVGAPVNFSFHLGMDTISFWLVLLTVFLQPLAVAASFESIKDRAKEYYAWMSLLLMAMIGCFLARDLLLFYIFFELTLIPMFFIIGIWGGPQRRYAAGKFFLFTFTGSVFTLAGIVYLGIKAGTFDLNHVVYVAQTALSPTERYWVFLAFLAGFSVKIPLFPVHTWLPLAHTEAPTAGSVILAGVLLKLGTYGLLRFAVPMGLPDVTYNFSHFLAVLCIIGVIYGALVAWVQQDIKKLVAYSSVSHLGFCILGLVAMNTIGIQGSVMYMINHGLSTGALFLTIGMIYDRFHTRDINELSGLAKKMPKLAFFFVLFAMSSIGLPGLNGFVSEFLTVLGAFTSPRLGPIYAAFAATGVILGALYMLHMVGRVIFGPLKYPGFGGSDHGHGSHGDSHGDAHAPVSDIGAREITILIPIALAVVILGVMPMSIMRSINTPIQIIETPAVAQQPTPHRSARVAAATDVKIEKEAL